jgi:DNA-directed RNA polymerase subunit RPC12/RpoP
VIEKRGIMGCCLDLLEMRLYQIVARVKNQHRTGRFDDAIRCHTCGGKVEHRFVKKNFLGFTVHIACPKCEWDFEG